ncbi:MAG: dihydrodipicolinate reductase [Sphingobium sp.]
MKDTPIKTVHLPDPRRVYRVAQWSTGRIGICALRNLISSPQMEVVGVYVHSAEKDGRDAGELCGLDPIGVRATRDIEKIIALKPDCVVAVQEGDNIDDICRFLEAGINVATSRVSFVDPFSMDQGVRQRIEAACRRGRSSLHASGASPGFGSESLPLVAATLTRTIDAMVIDEFALVTLSCPDAQITDVMHFGRQPGDAFDPDILAHLAKGFVQAVPIVGRGLGLKLDGCEVTGEVATARNRFLLPGGTPIERGTVAAQRVTISGMLNGKPIIRYRVNWYCTKDVNEDWDLRPSGWRVQIEGDVPVDINVTFPVSGEKLSPAMAGLTAYRVINAIPHVCAAEPGILTVLDLPNLAPQMDRRMLAA